MEKKTFRNSAPSGVSPLRRAFSGPRASVFTSPGAGLIDHE